MKAIKFWSCKLKRPDTLNSHLSLEAATKKAGDHGFVYCPESDRVYQAHRMAGGSLKLFDTVEQTADCNTGGFDMRAAMAAFGIPTGVAGLDL